MVKAHDKLLTFRAEENYAVFESFDADRQPVEEFRIKCMEKPLEKKRMCDYMFFGGGAMHATSGDLRGDGSSDIIISVATDFDKIDNTIVLWESEDYSFEKAGLVPIRAAVDAAASTQEYAWKASFLTAAYNALADSIGAQNAVSRRTVYTV